MSSSFGVLLLIADVWIRAAAPPGASSVAMSRIRPEVHSVEIHDNFMEVSSAGISLIHFGPFTSPGVSVDRVRQFRFRIPRHPQPASGSHTAVRPDMLGVFVNGVPIYNRFEGASYQEQGLWHFDEVARIDDPGILRNLINDSMHHSPIIGFSFDGYPIYGPWGYKNSDGTGGLHRMTSSYRPRSIRERQYGPLVDRDFPLGTFVEDYEYASGHGDLDQFNGRFTVTPEYPEGTYAYFLATDADGRLAFPYLIADSYYGKISTDELNDAVRDLAVEQVAAGAGDPIVRTAKAGEFNVEMRMASGKVAFRVIGPAGNSIRHLEYVHERPMHLVIASEDLEEFQHIHPVLSAGDEYQVTANFQGAGRHRLYLQFTPPGSGEQTAAFDVNVSGEPRPARVDEEIGGVRVKLSGAESLEAGKEQHLVFEITSAESGEPVRDLEPYLGAWAHVLAMNRKHTGLLHFHAGSSTAAHTHSPVSGDSPDVLHVAVNFPTAGVHKLWLQIQRNDNVITIPFVVTVR